MNRKYIALFATVPLMIGLTSTFVSAQVGQDNRGGFEPRFGHGGQFAEMRERWIEALDLSEEQQAEIQAIHEQTRVDHSALVEQLQQERENLRSLLAEDASPDQLRQQHNEIQQLQQQLGDAMFDVRLEIRDVLTEEQRNQLAELMPERPMMGHGFHGRHGGGRF